MWKHANISVPQELWDRIERERSKTLASRSRFYQILLDKALRQEKS